MRARPTAIAAALTLLATLTERAEADDVTTMPPPCTTPIAVSLADRPGTGRTTTTGGSPCVLIPGEAVLETGVRRQNTIGAPGSISLYSGPLTFLRVGVANRLELGIAPPAPESRATSGVTSLDAARGASDMVIAAKYLLLNTSFAQASLGAAYAPPTGWGGFSAEAPTYSATANLGFTLTSKLSLTMSHVFGTAVGADVVGENRTFFVYAPSFTLAYGLDAATTILVQDALVSRQGPLLPAGSRGFIALQHQLGGRIALDLDFERNLAPTLGSGASAVGFGVVWIAAPGRTP